MRSGAAALPRAPIDEDDGGEQDHQPPAVVVGGRAGDRGAADGADRDRGDDQALGEAAEAEVGLDEQQGPGDDPGVVAEQQPAEAGDGRGQDHVAPRPPRGRLRSPVHAAAERTSAVRTARYPRAAVSCADESRSLRKRRRSPPCAPRGAVVSCSCDRERPAPTEAKRGKESRRRRNRASAREGYVRGGQRASPPVAFSCPSPPRIARAASEAAPRFRRVRGSRHPRPATGAHRAGSRVSSRSPVSASRRLARPLPLGIDRHPRGCSARIGRWRGSVTSESGPRRC